MHGLIDSHFHLLALKQKGVDILHLLDKLFESGFQGGIDIGIRRDDLAERNLLLKDYPQIKVAAGIGPWGAQEPLEGQLEAFRALCDEEKIDALGEIGLDFYWNYGTVEDQITLCKGQIELANELKIPVIFHTREADDAMGELIKGVSLPHSGILHCFSSTWALAKTVLDKGLYISFAGPITYKKSDALRSVLAKVPLDRLLLETDSPYLAPQRYRGEINTPLYIGEIYQEAARVKGISLEELIEAIGRNFTTLFC
jgi:TatD DNase family protein